jgi:hypothetical protein
MTRYLREVGPNMWEPVTVAEIVATMKVAKAAPRAGGPHLPTTRSGIDDVLVRAAAIAGLALEELLETPPGRVLLKARDGAPHGTVAKDAREPITFVGDGILSVIERHVVEKGEPFLSSPEGIRLVASFEELRG